jgi:hypothetical protein
MESLVVLGILSGIGYAFYQEGKRMGSRKGYSVGRWRSKRR